jgi:PadR family transcriptional regulator PadR
MDLSNWTTQLRKGVLELCIVNLLARGELYGYDLVKHLAQVKGLVVTEGTVYPLLSRLKKTGLLETRLVESPSGPARKYYALTREGLKARTMMKTYWLELVQGIDTLSGDKSNG